MPQPTVPNGWSIEQIGHGIHSQLLVTSPKRYMATADLRNRGFRAGHALSGRFISTTIYAGRKWQQRLVDDAVAWLGALRPLAIGDDE